MGTVNTWLPQHSAYAQLTPDVFCVLKPSCLSPQFPDCRGGNGGQLFESCFESLMVFPPALIFVLSPTTESLAVLRACLDLSPSIYVISSITHSVWLNMPPSKMTKAVVDVWTFKVDSQENLKRCYLLLKVVLREAKIYSGSPEMFRCV